MLVNLQTIVDAAHKEKYAIGAFNCYNYETIKGTIEAASEINRPVIVAFGAKYLPNMSLADAHAIVSSLASNYDIPICLHLDHCSDLDVIKSAIEVGFTSVMYDGSMLPYEKNIENTKKVVQLSHSKNVSVEAELGSLATGLESHEGSENDIEKYTDPQQAKEFVEKTGVDALAVSIGTVHGLYKGEPNIRIDILKEINEKVKIPLVLHGGSGTPSNKLRKCITNGIAKINVNTEISKFVVDETKKLLNEGNLHYSTLSLKQQHFVKEVVKKYLHIFNNETNV